LDKKDLKHYEELLNREKESKEDSLENESTDPGFPSGIRPVSFHPMIIIPGIWEMRPLKLRKIFPSRPGISFF